MKKYKLISQDEDLVSLLIDEINFFEDTDSSRDRLKNIVCIVSEKNELKKDLAVKELLFIASNLLKSYGYNYMNNIDDNINQDIISSISFSAIKKANTSSVILNGKKPILDGKQKKIIDTFENMNGNKRILVSAPTSFGKTFILQEIIFLNKEKYKNIMLIFPTIALLNENAKRFTMLIKEKNFDYKIISNNFEKIIEENKHIFIFTPERALKFMGKNPNLRIDFFFFDEVYKIDEDYIISEENESDIDDKKKFFRGRGLAFRTCLYLLSNSVKDYYISGPFISFDKENISGIEAFLSKNKIKAIYANFDPTVRFKYQAWQKLGITEKSEIFPDKYYEFEVNNNSKKSLVKRVGEFIIQNQFGKTIFYCLRPYDILNYVDILRNNFPKKVTDQRLLKFIEHLENKYNLNYRFENINFNTKDYWHVIQCLKNGIGVHHGKLPKYIQNEILENFNCGELDYLFCTSTIIEGVNTEAKNVVMINNSPGNGESKTFSLKNIKGRAGRYYHNFIGRVFYLEKSQDDLDEAASKSGNLSLKFINFLDVDLDVVDIDITSEKDLALRNKIKKVERNSNFRRDLVPNIIYIQNILIDRVVQEKIVKYLLKEETVFYNLLSRVRRVTNLNTGYYDLFESIIKLYIDCDILCKESMDHYIYTVKKYNERKFNGLLDYQIDKLFRKRIKNQYYYVINRNIDF